MFVAESNHGDIEIYRGMTKDGKPEQTSVFATGLSQPFGIAFYPIGKDPQWVYIGDTNAVVRFPYKNGDLKATGDPETIVSGLPRGGHWTRDVVFSKDGTKMFVAVGSGSNVDDPDTHPDRASPRKRSRIYTRWQIHRGLWLRYSKSCRPSDQPYHRSTVVFRK